MFHALPSVIKQNFLTNTFWLFLFVLSIAIIPTAILNGVSTTLGTFEHQLLCIYILRETLTMCFLFHLFGKAADMLKDKIMYTSNSETSLLCLSITDVISSHSNLPQHNLNVIWNNTIKSDFLFFKPNKEAFLQI